MELIKGSGTSAYNNQTPGKHPKEYIISVSLYLLLLHLGMMSGPGSSVDIATDYRLDGPGSNPGGDEIFRLSRLALGPTRPPVKWVAVNYGLCKMCQLNTRR